MTTIWYRSPLATQLEYHNLVQFIPSRGDTLESIINALTRLVVYALLITLLITGNVVGCLVVGSVLIGSLVLIYEWSRTFDQEEFHESGLTVEDGHLVRLPTPSNPFANNLYGDSADIHASNPTDPIVADKIDAAFQGFVGKPTDVAQANHYLLQQRQFLTLPSPTGVPDLVSYANYANSGVVDPTQTDYVSVGRNVQYYGY